MNASFTSAKEHPNEVGTIIDQIKQRTKVKKILIAGSGAVGKTSLLKVLKEGKLQTSENSEYHRTLFLNIETLKAQDITDDQKVGIIQVVDIAGQLDQPVHPVRDAPRLAFGGVDAIILVFSADDFQSLIDIEKWQNILNSQFEKKPSETSPKYILVKNKVDLRDAFDEKLVDVLRNQPQFCAYFETSCLNGTGIDELRKWLSENLLEGGD